MLAFVLTHRSALILACEKGSAEVAELLLSHGADVGVVDNMGHDALHYALHTQDKVLWQLLRQALNRRQQAGKSQFPCNFKILLDSLRIKKLFRIPFVPMKIIHLMSNFYFS